MTQTQILEGSDELPDDEVESPLLFGILEGRDNTMHQSLYSHEAPYTFGTSDNCDVKISHAHWPDDKKTKEPWFRLTCTTAPGNEATNQVVATVHDLSSSGLYINGRKVGKGKRCVLSWGNQIAGGPHGNELFVYTYKLPKDDRRIIETGRTRYELEDEETGHGMYSKVYKAKDLQHDGYYACKVTNRLTREYSEVELRSMQNEIELLKSLRHVNIVKFEDVCTLGSTTYMFTELIEGVTLHKYYSKCHPFMTELDARHIFKQNVMVGPNNIVKLIDFGRRLVAFKGLARESSDASTMLYTFCGTPSYMAPETAVNGDEKNAYGPAVDVWALGVMLFRMLTGCYPFDKKTYADEVAFDHYKAPEAEGVAQRKAEGGANADLSEVEADVKKKSDKVKAEPVEALGIPRETSSEETDMVGVERRAEKIVYGKRRLPSYLHNWRPIVDIQIERIKELLDKMLKIDPSQRIRIQHVLHTDWIRMMDEELEKLDKRFSQRQLAVIFKTPIKDDSEFENVWGLLEIVPGSVSDAPRRIGLYEEELWLGRAIEKVGVYLGGNVGLSGRHCQIKKTPEGITVVDASYLKYKVKIFGAPEPTPEQLVRRQYFSASFLIGAPSRPNVRKLDLPELPKPEGWLPDDVHAWATLAPINDNTAVENLCTGKVVVGRYLDCDVIIPSNLISRYHCKFEWDEENRAAYLTNMGQNSVKINGSSFSGHVQLRENDVIHLFSAASYDESDWLGYTFHYLVDKGKVRSPPFPSIQPPSPIMNSYEDDDIANEVDLVVSAYPVQDDGLDEELLAADQTSQQYQEVLIPEVVKNFIVFFHRNVLENNTHELHSIYEHSFNKLTEKFYAKESWPEPEAIAPLVNDDQVFLTLYRELFYRHIYSRLTPTIEHRFHSYENYCDLFNYILNSEGPVPLELPNQWLWDIIDEFIYQFQSFCNYRNRIKNKTDEELAFLRDNSQIWSCYSVLNVLYSLIQKSRITEQLLVSKNGGDMQEAAGEYGSRPLYKMLGYFSIVGLLRVHCLLGDFTLALKMMDNIELNKKQALFARVTACHVTTYYYVGFAYMMMRRYADAIKAFSHILTFINRTKQYHTRSYQHDQINKKGDQMYALLTMCVTLCPTRLDENIHSQLREKYAEQSNKLTKPEEALQVFEELFLFACPKFISPNGPNLDDPEVMNLTPFDPVQHYTKIFLAEVRHSILLPTLRSYLKLYTTMGNAKLASFLEVDPEQLRTLLMMSKIRSRQIKWVEGTLLEGEYQGTSDLDFCMKEDMIHIAESKIGRRYGDWFLRNINKFQDILGGLELSAKA
ncbi:hypothetical protein BGZ96_009993 [Linnemannia gamsii]|uniref:Eukaryotic translation initiation factor 3 subunit L n=1 Tax=Linnemannia gamsii TaxID=64522 RepID=A0ABQ7KC66_9FUNG|nr:hypothetical protein BGZ96_009993 [Linnemannia gamsii]